MAILKCKICGNALENTGNAVTAFCGTCGVRQTLPKTMDDALKSLFNRANQLRFKNEFEKAETIYKEILEQDSGEAEAYWGIVLCRYGVKYENDFNTSEQKLNCYRVHSRSIFEDAEYLAAVDYSEPLQQNIYESEAYKIDRIQKNILGIVANEAPFDVFLCCEKPNDNNQTPSILADEIYDQLTKEGFRVFYAPAVWKHPFNGKEAYSLAALYSAKMMLVIGTARENFTEIWVKNEWSYYLKLMKNDPSKQLIPCYRDMDSGELPSEFSVLEARDMSKISFLVEIIREIRKMAPQKSEPALHSEASPLLRRIQLFLEDGDFKQADDLCERVLDKEPENASAYIGKLLAEFHCHSREELAERVYLIDTSKHYHKILRFGSEQDAAFFRNIGESARHRNQKDEEWFQAQKEKEKKDAEYVDLYCPYCGEKVSYQQWEIKQENLICPWCESNIEYR